MAESKSRSERAEKLRAELISFLNDARAYVVKGPGAGYDKRLLWMVVEDRCDSGGEYPQPDDYTFDADEIDALIEALTPRSEQQSIQFVMLDTLPEDHPLRNAPLASIGAEYAHINHQHNEDAWKPIEQRAEGVATYTFNGLYGAWAQYNKFRAPFAAVPECGTRADVVSREAVIKVLEHAAAGWHKQNDVVIGNAVHAVIPDIHCLPGLTKPVSTSGHREALERILKLHPMDEAPIEPWTEADCWRAAREIATSALSATQAPSGPRRCSLKNGCESPMECLKNGPRCSDTRTKA